MGEADKKGGEMYTYCSTNSFQASSEIEEFFPY